MSSTNPPTDGASYTASLHANVLADDVNDRMVDYYHNNGINWPNPTYTQGQVGDPYEPVAYYGTYSLEDINGFYDRLDYVLNSAETTYEQFVTVTKLAGLALGPSNFFLHLGEPFLAPIATADAATHTDEDMNHQDNSVNKGTSRVSSEFTATKKGIEDGCEGSKAAGYDMVDMSW